MAVLVRVVSPSLKPEQYDRIVRELKLDTNVPHGMLFHVPTFTPRGMETIHIWDSEQDFRDFVDSRLKPTFQQLGYVLDLDIAISPVHRIFAPAFTPRPEYRGAEWSEYMGGMT